MDSMIKTSRGWSVGKRIIVAVALLTLAACGGGGGGSSSSGASQTLTQQVHALVASGTASDLEAAMDLVLANQDTITASELEALMDELAAA